MSWDKLKTTAAPTTILLGFGSDSSVNAPTMMDLEELFLRAEGKDCYICGKAMLRTQVLFVTFKSRVVVHDVCARRVEIDQGERRASRRDEDLTGPHKLPEAKETPPYRILEIKSA